MKKNIYRLKSDFINFSLFYEKKIGLSGGIQSKTIDQRWMPIESGNYIPVELELQRSETGKKNYQFDISSFMSPFYILSEECIDKLGDIFLPRGQIFDVISDSKRKKFFGYYPTNSLSGCLDKENSKYREYPNGLMIDKLVLLSDAISDDFLFTIEEDISHVFITETFINRVNNANLKGFDFSRIVETR